MDQPLKLTLNLALTIILIITGVCQACVNSGIRPLPALHLLRGKLVH